MAVFTFSDALIEGALTYDQYRKGLHALIQNPPPGEAAQRLLPYTQKNQEFMDEYDRTYRVSDELREVMKHVPAMNWIVITEGWCGDAAFNVPMFALLEDLFPDRVRLRLFLRDKNLDLIDAYLTQGGRSIPKLVLLDADFNECGTWGPRPEPLMNLMPQWKENGDSLPELIRKTHEWYNTDQTLTLQQELAALLSSITRYKK